MAVFFLAGFWLCVSVVHARSGALPDTAVEKSQQAIGNRLTNVAFIDTNGEERRLEEFLGKPAAISLIYTSCAHSCSVITPHIKNVTRIARNSLGPESFSVLTIGFDLPVDTPENMASYARRHNVDDPNWHFLTPASEADLEKIMDETGFHRVPSPAGFDHTVQLTLLNESGKLTRQIYGETFDTPLLVEPLKHMVLGTPKPDDGLFARVSDRVRLFCTVYDPKADRYYFDYSLLMGILAGVLVIGFSSIWLVGEIRYRRRSAVDEH